MRSNWRLGDPTGDPLSRIFASHDRVSRSSGHELALVGDVVDQDIFAEAIRRGDEDATRVDPHQIIYELHHVRRALEHEGIDGDAVARAADDLAQRLLERARCRRIAKTDMSVVEMGRRLAI